MMAPAQGKSAADFKFDDFGVGESRRVRFRIEIGSKPLDLVSASAMEW